MSLKTSRPCPVSDRITGVFFFLLASVATTNSVAQCVRITPTETCGSQYTLTLAITNGSAGSWSIGLPAGKTLASLGLTGTPVGTTSYVIQGLPTETGDINITATATSPPMSTMNCSAGCPEPGNPTACTTTTARINTTMHLKAPVDVTLVLDVSGSMGQLVAPGSMTKLQVLRDAVTSFLTAYNNFGKCYNQIGLTYFDGQRRDFSGGRGLKPLSSIPMMQTDVGSKTPGTTTCIGGGILEGHSFFVNASRVNRHIILFTDGIQNMDPIVDTDFVIRDSGTKGDGTGFPYPPPLDLKTINVKLQTVEIGDGSMNSFLESLVAAPTNSLFDGDNFPINNTSNLAMDLQNHFDQAFVNALALFSPQLIDVQRLNVVNTASTRFTVNPSADQLMIKVVADPERLGESRIRIQKDGKDLSSLVRTGGQTYKIFFIDSTAVKRYGTTLKGVFNVSITGPSGKYQVTSMVNDEELKASANLGNVTYAPGDTIQLEAVLGYDTLPITNAARATVWIAKPGEDVNDLFAKAGPIDIPAGFPGEAGNDPGQAKYEALIALNGAFAAALQPIIDSINLTNQSNGKYAATFGDTQKSGVYNFVFRLAGNDTLTGPFERFVQRSAVVDFGQADPGKTIFQIVTREGKLFFLLTPKNRFDHFIGPNRLAQIKLFVDGKIIKLADRLDGSYEAAVPDFPFLDPDPKVVVDIKGDVFYDDDYSGIEGSHVPFLAKYWMWILILILIILLIIFLLRRRNSP